MGALGGKVAVVTGASRGIGADVARMLASEGALVVCCARTLREGGHPLAGSLEQTVGDIHAAGGTALAVQVNLASDNRPDMRFLAWTKAGPVPLQPGATTITFTTPGSFLFICHLPGHEAYGMVGTLVVRGS